MNERRDNEWRVCLVISASLCLCEFGGAADRHKNALIGSTAAKIVGHRRLDLGLGRILALRKQSCGGHDLTALAITALRDANLHPGSLNRMRAIVGQSFNGCDLLADGGGCRKLA